MYNINIRRRPDHGEYKIELNGLFHKYVAIRRPLNMELADFYWDDICPLIISIQIGSKY